MVTGCYSLVSGVRLFWCEIDPFCLLRVPYSLKVDKASYAMLMRSPGLQAAIIKAKDASVSIIREREPV